MTLIVHLEVKYALKVRANVDDATSACDACASKRLVRPVSLCVRVEFFVYPLVGVCITLLCVFRGIERFWFGRGVVEDAIRGRWIRG